MVEENMVLDGYYHCTTIRKVAQIGRDQTKQRSEHFHHLIMHLFVVLWASSSFLWCPKLAKYSMGS